jgi:Uri superfamily endonuclease
MPPLSGDLQRIPMNNDSSYQLFFSLCKQEKLTIGKLGAFTFPAGFYVYTGSAKRNIGARTRRHLSGDKKLHWHIDYLLASPYAEIIRVETSGIGECELNQRIDGHIPARGFGASDCRNRCGSHLKYIGAGSEAGAAHC